MSYLAIHAQDEVPRWKDGVLLCKERGSPYRCIKFFQTEPYAWIKANSPATAYIFRQYVDDVNQEAWIYAALESPAEADRVADEFIATFKDSVNQHLGTTPGRAVYVESLNEQYPTGNQTKLDAIIAFDRAFIRRLPVNCPGVRPVVFTAAIGNPDHPDKVKLLPLARECAAAKGAMGYHAYHTVHRGQSFVLSAAHQRDLHMRWSVTFDAYFVSQGVYVDWFLGEGGATGCNPDGYNPGVLTGWKHPDTWNNDRGAYVQDLANLDAVLTQTVAAKQGRLLGLTLFTSKVSPDQWQYFNLVGDDLMAVAEYVSTHPTAPPTPPTPPPNPLPGLRLSSPFHEPFVVSSPFDAPREYGKHEGVDYVATSQQGNELIHCGYDGTVDLVTYSATGYGKYVRVKHIRNGGTFWTYYAHLDTQLVAVGNVVKAGDVMGEVGSTGNSTGPHVHITLRVPNYGLSGYVIPDVVNPDPHIDRWVTPSRNYFRTCHLLPQDATPAEYQRVTTEAYATRQSVLQSIDDALITHPNLTGRKVYVWGDVSRHGAFTDVASFENWVVQNYPPLPEIIYRGF